MQNFNLRGKRILITGITGFIGSHLADELKKRGAEVYGISRRKGAKGVYKANILNLNILNAFIKKNKISICFHLAAESLVEEGQENPHKTFKTNILGTLNILEASRINGLEKIIIASSAHVYGKNKLPFVETYTPKPTRPYETSKTSIDIIAQSYADSFQLPVVISRFVNVYGPGDLNFNRLIPKTMKNIVHNIAPTMWGGDVIRDFLYIDDAVHAYIALAKYKIPDSKSNRVFNFGGGNKITILDLVNKAIVLAKKKLKIKHIPVAREDEIKKQYVSFAKARKVLSWEPKVPLETGLKKTILWYEEYFNKTTRI